MWVRTGGVRSVLTIPALLIGVLPQAHAAVDLQLRPPSQTVVVGTTAAIGLYAVSDDETDQPVGRVRAILAWDPALLELTGISNNGPYAWFLSGFPDDSGNDGLNNTFTDGDALYEAVAQIGDPAMATPGGLLVTTLQFTALATTTSTTVSIVPQIGGTFTEVLDAVPPNGQDVTGTLGSAAVTVICQAPSDCDDNNPCTDDACESQMCQNVPNDANDPDDGLYCNGVEDFCAGGEIVYLVDPPDCDDALSCTADSCDEDTDACVNALMAGFCLIEDGARRDSRTSSCYGATALNPANDCELCDPAADPIGWSFRVAGAACGDPSDAICDAPDSCDGAGFCEPNNEPDGLACPDDGNDCTQDVCDGGVCTHPPEQVDTPCGSSTDDVCTDPDTCDGAGLCVGNHAPDATPCDDGLFCTATSECTDGVCTGSSDACPDLMCDEFAAACKGVDLEWRPVQQSVMVGEVVSVDLYAVSATSADMGVASIALIVEWDPAGLELLGHVDNGPYGWITSGFPDDCQLDGLNAPCTGLPFNDGDVYYVAVAQFSPAPPAIATPAGLWVTTFEFQALTAGPALVEMTLTFGADTQSQVLDAETAGLDILIALGPATTVDVMECLDDDICTDGAFCNGAETCDLNGVCQLGSDPCPGLLCRESDDTCVACLTDGDCGDGEFCNGIETCDEGGDCQPGSDPCPGQLCDDVNDLCVECLSEIDCDDDGIPCTTTACIGGACTDLPDDAFCANEVFCDGDEVCVVGTGCMAGENPCPDPDTCEEGTGTCGGCAAPALEAEGCRYLAVTPPAGVNPVALLVTGDPADPDIACIALYVQADDTLGETPVFQTPDVWQTAHVRGADILPSERYKVHMDCGQPGDPLLSAAASATTWLWGDVNNSGTVDLDDVVLVANAVGGIFVEVTLENVDLHGAACVPDRLVDQDDLDDVLAASEGEDQTCPYRCITGACCLEDGTCQDAQASEDCAAAGGNYAGPMTACSAEVLLFGDVSPPYAADTPDPQPDVADIVCLLDDFADGPPVDGCAGSVVSTDLAPCGGDGIIDLDDVLFVLDAFAQVFRCPHPCP